jgi:hypothetical protein
MFFFSELARFEKRLRLSKHRSNIQTVNRASLRKQNAERREAHKAMGK